MIAEAVARRAPLAALPDLTAYRLVHYDTTPGLAVDRYDDLLVIHADSDAILDAWRASLRTVLADYRAAVVKLHPVQASRQPSRTQPLWGPQIEALEALEHGQRFEIRTDAGLNVGLFLDMREVRGWLRSVARGLQVLNLFAYTCSFGVAAMLGGAARVLNLDLSRNYLDWGHANYCLNDLPAHARDFVYGDAFDWLARFARRAEHFDLVIVDPPSFSTSSSRTFTVQKDYPRLAELAARVVAPGGMLLAATNHAGTSDAFFDALLRTALDAAARPHHIERRWHEPTPDFPLTAGGTPYLKVRALVLE